MRNEVQPPVYKVGAALADLIPGAEKPIGNDDAHRIR